MQNKKGNKQLPNGMFICEKCGKEHDGNYGSGRFCSDKCRRQYSCEKSCETMLKNNTRYLQFRINKNTGNTYRQSAFGRWKCSSCEFIARTRKELYQHKNECNHHGNKGGYKGIKMSEEQKEKISQALRGKSWKCKTYENERARREKISKIAKLKHFGGIRKGSGRGKHGWYKGIWCDSSWELAWVIYNFEHGIFFKRYVGFFEYSFNGKTHKYYPDFILENGVIVEIKGIESSECWKAKLEQFPKDKTLQIIGKNEIKKYLDYVIAKYGKNFISLYESQKFGGMAETE